ncbi:MAG TPA: hypothetical protein VG271_12135 [Beijerinckiaceae bacterium]|nr:hypothetical protein [Beijerinckiaceae bacterium]
MFVFGAALGSFLAKLGRPRRVVMRRRPRRAEPSPRVVFALVQTRPHVVVLAVSASEDELIKEMNELNSTWNHWNLRTEGHRYEVQRVPVLVDVPSGVAATTTASIAKSR